MSLNPANVRDQAALLDATVWVDTDRSKGLGSRVIAAIHRNRRGGSTHNDGMPGSSWDVTGTSKSTEDMTTVERAALANLPEARQGRDEVAELTEQIEGYWSQLWLTRGALVNALERFDNLTGERATDKCCEPICTDPAIKAGRCGACYMRKRRWEQTHNGEPVPPLSETEWADRTRTRQRAG